MEQDWESFWERRKTKISWSKKRIIKIIDKHLTGKVLDAGCGSGFFSKYFVDKGCETIAMDNSKKALELTKELDERIIVKEGDVFNIPFKDEYFDVIFSDGLLEHYPNPEDILLEFRRVLKSTGKLMTFVPNKFSYWFLAKPFIMKEIDEYAFNLNKLIDLHERTNFKIIESGGISVLPTRYSPEFLGKWIGRLLYVIARKE
jgi:ubiquinone/menaquinone biosynthesis C-methylase UbiE